VKIFHILIIILGVLLLGFLIYSLGPLLIWRELMLLGWGIVPLILLEGCSRLFHTQALRHCLSGSHRALPFKRVFGVLMAGGSINYLTPTAGLGGEVTKGLLLASDRSGSQAASAVILDKLFYSLAQLILITCGSCIFLTNIVMPRAWWLALISVTVAIGLGIIGFFLVQRYGKLGSIIRWAVRHRLGGAALQKTACSMTEVDKELQCFHHSRPVDLLLSISWHLAGFLWGIIPTFYFLVLTTDSPSLSMAVLLVILGNWFDLAAFVIPVDIGVQEATRVLAFRIVGFSSALGLTYGITHRLQQLFWAGMGLLFYSMLASTRTRGLQRSSCSAPKERFL